MVLSPVSINIYYIKKQLNIDMKQDEIADIIKRYDIAM
jgi:hypothetical protein